MEEKNNSEFEEQSEPELNESETQATEEVHEPEPMGHLDKMVGVFSDPGETFYSMSQHEPKSTDWVLPIISLILITIISIAISFSNPEIKAKMMQKQREAMEKQFEERVASGDMSQEQADQIMERSGQFMGNSIMMVVFPAIGILIITFIWFFFFSLVGWLIAKSVFGDIGGFKQAMSALGLPMYISFLGGIIALILSVAMGKMGTGVNVAFFTGADITTFSGFIQSKADIFSIWFYVVVGIAFAKMFKSQSTGKYIGASVGLWLVLSIIVYILATSIPAFSGLLQ